MSFAATNLETLCSVPSPRSDLVSVVHSVRPKMNAQMKGLLKGLRYISKIFDGKEEQEMQIGFPTDVKHVAHIGWDGPTVNAPTWMNEFPSAPHSAPFASDGSEPNTSNKWAGQDSSLVREKAESVKERRESVKERRRRQTSSGGPDDSPGRGAASPGGSRHSRRHQSDVALSADSPGREPSDASRRGRRQTKSAGSGEAESDLPAIPRQSRPRRTKGSTGGSGGSGRPKVRSRAPASDPEAPEDHNGKPVPVLEPTTEEQEEEEEEGRL